MDKVRFKLGFLCYLKERNIDYKKCDVNKVVLRHFKTYCKKYPYGLTSGTRLLSTDDLLDYMLKCITM